MNPIADERLGKLTAMEFPIEQVLSVGCNQYSPGWKVNRIGKSCTIYYVGSGTVGFTLNGQTSLCRKNTLFYLEKEEVAQIYNAEPEMNSDLYYVTFHLKPGYKMLDCDIPRPLPDESGQLLQLLQKLYRTELSEGAAYKIRRFYEFSQLFYELITHWLHTDALSQTNRKLRKAIEYIKINYRKSITVEELSQVVGYSVSHFRRLFAENCGMSPQAYILQTKLHRAKLLLEEQSYTVTEIAELLGFCSASYFCKLFKTKIGISPYQYQKHHAQFSSSDI